MTIEILMKKSTPGSQDGSHVTKFAAGIKYHVVDKLAKTFVGMGVAEFVIEEKAVSSAPKNAAMGNAPDNKSSEEDKTEDDVVSDLLTGGDDEKDDDDQSDDDSDDDDEKEDKDNKSGRAFMRVFQLAEELGRSSKKIVKVAKGLGIFTSTSSSGLTESEVNEIREAIKK